METLSHHHTEGVVDRYSPRLQDSNVSGCIWLISVVDQQLVSDTRGGADCTIAMSQEAYSPAQSCFYLLTRIAVYPLLRGIASNAPVNVYISSYTHEG